MNWLGDMFSELSQAMTEIVRSTGLEAAKLGV